MLAAEALCKHRGKSGSLAEAVVQHMSRDATGLRASLRQLVEQLAHTPEDEWPAVVEAFRRRS